jgi:lipoate-protein ligase A
MRSLNYIKISGLPILRQLQLEEFLLRTTKNNWFIYNHDISSPTIVLGFSAKVHELIHIDEVIVHNVNTIRRYTGGGTVIVDKDTIFTSLIMNVSTYLYGKRV